MMRVHAMRMRTPATLLLAALAGVAFGCRPAARPPAADVTAPSHAAPTEGGSWRVAWSARGGAIPLNEPFVLDVAVRRGDTGEPPSEGVSVVVDAGMPSHGHGMTLEPRTEPAGPGAWTVDGMLFHMPGPWELEVVVVDGTATERAAFTVVIE